MSEKLSKPPRRGRRTVVFASLAAVAAMLVASVGAAPAHGDGVGTASARGTDPDASATIPGLGTFPATAQYSAITNCDEAQNTRPFYVTASNAQFGISATFKRTSTTASTCTSQGSSSINQGTGAGTATGGFTGPGTLTWTFQDSPDDVLIQIDLDSGVSLSVSGPPQPLNGTPGGVWVFGTLPWPAGT